MTDCISSFKSLTFDYHTEINWKEMASRTVLGGEKIKQNMYHSVVLSESNLQECKARAICSEWAQTCRIAGLILHRQGQTEQLL